LNLPKAAVSLETVRGKYIAVDEFQQTSAKGVYALGDVCGNVELTPVAIAAGRRLADRSVVPRYIHHRMLMRALLYA
jgi:glutathione reductase (NADPH)